MAPGYGKPSRIVRTIPGQSIGSDDDAYIDEDGRSWKRALYDDSTATVPRLRATMINGYMVPR